MNTLKGPDNESSFSLKDFYSSVSSVKWASFVLITSLLYWCNSWPSKNCDNTWSDVKSLAQTVVGKVNSAFSVNKWFSWDFQINVNWQWEAEITNNVPLDKLGEANTFLEKTFEGTKLFINKSWNWRSENWIAQQVWDDYFLEIDWDKSYVCKKK